MRKKTLGIGSRGLLCARKIMARNGQQVLCGVFVRVESLDCYEFSIAPPCPIRLARLKGE